MTAPTAPAPGAVARPEPPFPSLIVEELLRAIGRAVRAHQLYLQNNPIYLRSIEAAQAAFAPLWARTEELVLQITETEFRWEGVEVHSETEKAADSLPWLFFKDGVREIRLLRGFEREELVTLLALLRRVRVAAPEEDDLLTMLWEQDFVHLRYSYVDLSVDNAPPVDSVAVGERPVVIPPPAEDEDTAAARAGVVDMADFDSTLYFLDEREIEYLRGAVSAEYASDLRRNVLNILLDVFETQRDHGARAEVCEILDAFLVTLLSAGELRTVAHLLRESALAVQRAAELEPAPRARLASLADRLSDPATLGQLLQALDEAADPPPPNELAELFEQLRPAALGTIFGWLGRTQGSRVRPLLEGAAARLAAANTAELVRLIGAGSREVVLEAMRRAGGLRSAAAVAPLGKALTDADPALRLAAATALGEIGTPGALQALERAVEDGERDVRIVAARALGARGHRAALPRIESAVKGKTLRESNLTEKMAFFETYGALCGDAGVPLLDALLNGRGFLGRREDSEFRACAALALGRVGTPAAAATLQRAAAEKDLIVRNAVNKALRGGGA
ncbi:MAG: HEAT repeat domain-containing protein [Gemmatimonadaceae bacterium]